MIAASESEPCVQVYRFCMNSRRGKGKAGGVRASCGNQEFISHLDEKERMLGEERSTTKSTKQKPAR